jgi:hypothetical protein
MLRFLALSYLFIIYRCSCNIKNQGFSYDPDNLITLKQRLLEKIQEKLHLKRGEV